MILDSTTKKTSTKLILTLILLNICVYASVYDFGFINFDDDRYVTQNPFVRAGLNWASIKWAFSSIHASNWHPLSWMSHMLDIELFSNYAGGHHLTNVLIHIGNTILLFLLLVKASKRTFRSFVVAALFAIHPIHIESVAWVSERKDLLCAFFFLLGIYYYFDYVKNQNWKHYFAVFVSLILALLSKPMAVSFPIVLLLIDYWPLERKVAFHKLVLEKIPLALLSLLSCGLTFYAQYSTGAVKSMEQFALSARIMNAFSSYFTYLLKIVWPSNLSIFYPYAEGSDLIVPFILGLVMVVAFSVLLYKIRAKHKMLCTAWLWYLITLIPVIGIVQVGMQSMADRYTYLPSIGAFIAIVWCISDIALKQRFSKPVMIGGTSVLLLVLSILSFQQLSYWRSSYSLFTRAIEINPQNIIAQHNYGAQLLIDGYTKESIEYFKRAHKIAPDIALTNNSLGNALNLANRSEEAIPYFKKAIELAPEWVEGFTNLGEAYAKTGNTKAAAAVFSSAVKNHPQNYRLLNNAGSFYFLQRNLEKAEHFFLQAVRYAPAEAQSLFNIGVLQESRGRWKSADMYFDIAVKLNPALRRQYEWLIKARPN